MAALVFSSSKSRITATLAVVSLQQFLGSQRGKRLGLLVHADVRVLFLSFFVANLLSQDGVPLQPE